MGMRESIINKAIETLKKYMELCRFNPLTGEEVAMNADNEESAQAMEMAIEALKRQIPVKPHRNYKYLSAFWCECGWYISKQSDGYIFCPQCGHPIDWSY